MQHIVKSIACGLAAAAFAASTPAMADIEVYEDYEPAGEVVEMTMVKVDEGQFETYLEGLMSTWLAANKVAKELGHISDYKIYGVPYGDNSVNLVLTVTYSDENFAPSKARYEEFLEAYGKANIDQGNATVLELYNKIRTIQGTYMMREIKMLR